MDHHNPTPEPEPLPGRPQRRRRRPNGRWTNPASPLQAARFQFRKSGKEVVTAIRRICPGHSGEPCKLDVAKLSDYETGNRRPGLAHIEAFCRYYQRSPQQLGLIKWRDDPSEEATPDTQPDPTDLGPDHAHAHVVMVYVRADAHTSAATIASEVLRVLSQHFPVPVPTSPQADEDEPETDGDDANGNETNDWDHRLNAGRSGGLSADSRWA